MKKIVKQVVGIDVAQKELVVSVSRMDEQITVEIFAHKSFPNNPKGFTALMAWVEKLTDAEVYLSYVMEATGVYHERLAYFLEEKGKAVSIVLPSKISNYVRTLDVKTVTDKTASEAIARFGAERKLDNWKRPKAIFKKLRQLTRERDQVLADRTVAKNQLHAELAEAEPGKSSVDRIKKKIAFFDKQEKEIMTELKVILSVDDEIKRLVALICTLPGVGLLTAIIVLAETNGFELIRNKRQLVSYAGLDVKEKQSGTSVRGKPRISKKGNRFLRKAMHFPALCAIRHDEKYKAIFARLISKHGIKMKAAVCVQRKMLEMIYTIFKKQEAYDRMYYQKLAEVQVGA